MSIANIVSKNIKYFRKLKGLTQEMLAEKVDVSVVYINYIERSSRVPSLELLAKIADALEVDPALLLMQDHDPTSLEIKKLILIVYKLEKSTIQLITEMIIALVNSKNFNS